MKNYILSKSFSQNTGSCGVPVVLRKRKGDVVQGLISYYNPNITRLYIPCPNNPSKRVPIDVPTNILIQKKSSFDGTDSETNTERTGNSKMVKNVIMGVVAVGVIYALYKIFNK
jgi:hypothetical protein